MKESELRQKIFETNWNLQQSSPKIMEVNHIVKGIIIDLTYEYLGVTKIKKNITLTYKPSDPFYFKINCINDDCIYSTLDLTSVVREMIDSHSKNKTGQATCEGWQDYERFRAKNYHCLTTLNYNIEIKYNSSA